MPNVIVGIPDVAKHQRPGVEHPARFKLFRCGRRWGKDQLGVNVAFFGHGPERMHPGIADGGDVVWLTLDYSQALILWTENIVPRFAGIDGITLNASDHSVATPRGTLWIRSANNADAVRGSGKSLRGVIMNEAAHYDLEYVWHTVIRPALMDNQGWALIMSTTNRGHDGNQLKRVPSYFNTLCERVRAGDPRYTDWAEFTGTAYDNPALDNDEVDAFVADYPSESVALREEFYADLLEPDTGAGLVFTEWDARYHLLPVHYQPLDFWHWGAGLDWGYRSPGALVLFAAGPEGEQHAMDELYFQRTHDREMGRQIGALCQHYPMQGASIASDESMWNTTGVSAPTIAEGVQQGIYDAYGDNRQAAPRLIPSGRGHTRVNVKGQGWRETKLQVMHRALEVTSNDQGEVPPWGLPRLRFHPRCRNAIRTIPILPYAPVTQLGRAKEDVDTNADDHVYDAVACYLMARPGQPEKLPGRIDPDRHPGFDEQRQRRHWERATEPHYVPDYAPPQWGGGVQGLEQV